MYKNYEEIKTRCESLGGYIPEPKSQQENDFIHNLPIETNFYLGMKRDNLMATWIWQENLTDVKWKNWESLTNDRTKNCSVMLNGPTGDSSKKWDTFVCGNDSYREEITVVCQRGKGT